MPLSLQEYFERRTARGAGHREMLCWNNNVNKSDSEKPKLRKSKVTETVKFKSKENLKVRNIFLEKQGKARRTVYQVEYEAERNIFQESF